MAKQLKVDMPNSSIEQVFKMVNPALELKVTIDFQKHPNLDKLNLGCSATFEVFETTGKVNRSPLMTVTGNAPRSQDINPDCNPDIALGNFSIVGSNNIGFNVIFDSVKITQIHPEEGERLLGFFKNMYGVKILFKENEVAFLNQNDKNETVTFNLPYPTPYLEVAVH